MSKNYICSIVSQRWISELILFILDVLVMQRLGRFVLTAIVWMALFLSQPSAGFSEECDDNLFLFSSSLLECNSDSLQISYDAPFAGFNAFGFYRVFSSVHNYSFLNHSSSSWSAIRTIFYKYRRGFLWKFQLYIIPHLLRMSPKSCAYYIFALRRILV